MHLNINLAANKPYSLAAKPNPYIRVICVSA